MITLKNYFKCIASTDDQEQVEHIVHDANDYMTGHDMTKPWHLPIKHDILFCQYRE